MNGLSIIITICVLTIMTVISITVMIHYNKQFHQCDADSAFWCHSDWQCLNGTKDSKGNNVGTEGEIPMNCYILGTFGKIKKDDADCGKYYDKYNRPQSLCNGDNFTNAGDAPICKGSGSDGGKWPCSCTEILQNDFGKYAFQVGFTNSTSGGQLLMNKTGGVNPCKEGDEDCISFRDVITKQVGSQIAGMTASGACPEDVN